MITITGATGQLGRLILDNLLKKVAPAEIVAVARTPSKAADLAEQGITVRQGDYSDYDSLVSAFQGSDVLLFVSNTDFAKRMAEHQNVANAAVETGVGRVVYTSVFQPENDNMLAQTHRATEEMLRAGGLSLTFLRNNLYMDAYVVEVELAAKNGVYRTPTPADAGAAFVTREDIARAAAVVLTEGGHEGRAYDMTGPEIVTPTTFAAVASELSGKPVAYQPISWEQLKADYLERGMPPEWAEFGVTLERVLARGDFGGVSADIETLTGTPAESLLSFARRKLA